MWPLPRASDLAVSQLADPGIRQRSWRLHGVCGRRVGAAMTLQEVMLKAFERRAALVSGGGYSGHESTRAAPVAGAV